MTSFFIAAHWFHKYSPHVNADWCLHTITSFANPEIAVLTDSRNSDSQVIQLYQINLIDPRKDFIHSPRPLLTLNPSFFENVLGLHTSNYTIKNFQTCPNTNNICLFDYGSVGLYVIDTQRDIVLHHSNYMFDELKKMRRLFGGRGELYLDTRRYSRVGQFADPSHIYLIESLQRQKQKTSKRARFQKKSFSSPSPTQMNYIKLIGRQKTLTFKTPRLPESTRVFGFDDFFCVASPQPNGFLLGVLPLEEEQTQKLETRMIPFPNGGRAISFCKYQDWLVFCIGVGDGFFVEAMVEIRGYNPKNGDWISYGKVRVNVDENNSLSVRQCFRVVLRELDRGLVILLCNIGRTRVLKAIVREYGEKWREISYRKMESVKMIAGI